MTLVIVGADNFAMGGNLLVLQKHDLIQAIDSFLVYNSIVDKKGSCREGEKGSSC
jgi:hypothetical protein